MRLHHEVLGAAQERALAALAPVATKERFYLGGGTAIALQLGHRRSVDLDWFSETFHHPMRFTAELRRRGVPFSHTHVEHGTLYGTLYRVQASFIAYPYALLRRPVRAEGFQLASLDDLACMKLSAIVDRGSKKDFVDVFALCRRHKPLRDLLRLYQRRFRFADIGHVLVALSYFDDAEKTRMPRMLWPAAWPLVKRSISEWIVDAANRL